VHADAPSYTQRRIAAFDVVAMSLINPNQIQRFQFSVSDDPTNSNQFFGITGLDYAIPFFET
jgi:hypothetical protein